MHSYAWHFKQNDFNQKLMVEYCILRNNCWNVMKFPQTDVLYEEFITSYSNYHYGLLYIKIINLKCTDKL